MMKFNTQEKIVKSGTGKTFFINEIRDESHRLIHYQYLCESPVFLNDPYYKQFMTARGELETHTRQRVQGFMKNAYDVTVPQEKLIQD